MVRLAQLRGPLVAGLLWSAVALGAMQLRDEGGAVLLVWLPSAISVASLYATPQRRWSLVLAALFVAQILTTLSIGVPLPRALGFTAANLVEAVICATIGIKVLGGRANSPQTFRHIAGLFAAAMAGCAASAVVALPFRADPSVAELAWWFMATVLAILTATPALLYLGRRLGFGDEDVRAGKAEFDFGFFTTIAALFALGAAVIESPFMVLLPLLFVGIVFAVIRYGQLAGACGVIAYAVAGTLASLGGRSPAAFLDLDSFTAGLVFQALMLLMLATALPIASVLMTRDRLEARLRAQNQDLRDNLTMLGLAESLAGIGRWRYDLRSGTQTWSPLMLELNGLSPDLAPDPGNVRDKLPDGGEQLFGALAAHREDDEPYSFEYRISRDGAERILKMHVTNEFDAAGERVALFAVAMDVTEQVQREQALNRAREQAIGLAAEAQKMANTDALTGLANRRATLDWLGRLVLAAEEVDEPLAVIMFDVDHFKRVNDCFGHATGDQVLKRVAELTRGQVRAEDLVGRIGGEEFVCLLSGIRDREARALAERLCSVVARGSAADGLPLATISVGLAVHRAGDTAEDLLARADAALYEAKDAGRNQVRRAA